MGQTPAYDRWKASVIFHETPRGVRFDLRFYVYADGHGHVQHRDPDGKVQQENQPVNDVDEAMRVLRDLWLEAMKRADAGLA